MRALLSIFLVLGVSCADDSTPNNGDASTVENNATDAGGNATANIISIDSGSPGNADAGSDDGGLDAGPQPSEMACAPFEETNSCPQGEGCQPTTRDPQTSELNGKCVFIGSLELGEACDEESPEALCGAGLNCVSNRCVSYCDFEKETGAGSCPTEQGCYPLFDMGEALSFGACGPRCEFPHGDGPAPTLVCPAEAPMCVPGELYGLPFDLCLEARPMLEVGANCTDAGLSDGALCGASSGCLEYMSAGEVQCREFCFSSEGDFNVPNHPDCSDATDVCVGIFVETNIGVCHQPG